MDVAMAGIVLEKLGSVGMVAKEHGLNGPKKDKESIKVKNPLNIHYLLLSPI